MSGASTLRELALVFLRIGITGVGGPAAHVALMEHEIVQRRRWMDRRAFLDLVGATNLIPGPNSTELAMHIGHMRGGWRGLLVAGSCFILPAACISLILSQMYQSYGVLPQAQALLYGVRPVVVAIVARAIWSLGRVALTTPTQWGIAVAGVGGVVAGAHELAVLAAAAALAVSVRHGRPGGISSAPLVAMVTSGGIGSGTLVLASPPVNLPVLFLTFLKAGGLLFGSGYVLLAYLRADLVERLGWLTEAQLVDAISIGQMIPGPVFTTATFIGYLLGGPSGALVATIGIFLPAFVLVGISGRFVPALRRSPSVSAALDGVNAASIALMAVVLWELGDVALVDWLTMALALATAGALLAGKVHPWWLLAAGLVLGGLAHAS